MNASCPFPFPFSSSLFLSLSLLSASLCVRVRSRLPGARAVCACACACFFARALSLSLASFRGSLPTCLLARVCPARVLCVRADSLTPTCTQHAPCRGYQVGHASGSCWTLETWELVSLEARKLTSRKIVSWGHDMKLADGQLGACIRE
jgi:hypothetical protein